MSGLVYPPELNGDDSGLLSAINFTLFERKDIKASEQIRQIRLYSPEKMAMPSTVSWDTASFGFAANKLLGEMAKSGGGFASSSMEAIGTMIGEATASDARGLLETGINKAAASAAGAALGVPAADLMAESTKSIKNPFLTMMFRGVDFRSFEFAFKFSPRSADESKTIYEIINTFRKLSLPDGDVGDYRLKYPGEVEIEYIFNNERNKYMHRFKRSVITHIDVDYTGTGMFSSHRNGMPTLINMNLRFSEIELVLKKDVDTSPTGNSY